MKKNPSSPVKASIGYTFGNYLLKGIGFISVPIFARILTQEDYGIYNTFLAYESILYIFISLALHTSLKNAKIKYTDEFDCYTSSICIIPILNLAVLIILGFIFNGMIAELINIDKRAIIWLIVHSYCSGVVIFYSSKLSLDYNYKAYIGVSLTNAIGNVLLSLILIYTIYKNSMYMGRIVGSTVIYVIVTTYILLIIFKQQRPRVNKDYFLYGLRISLPIIPHGLAQIILLQFDRIMINAYIGSKEAAIYSFAYSIYSIVQITSNSLSTVFEPWFFKKMTETEDSRIRITSIATAMMAIIAFLVICLILFSPEAIFVLGGQKYKDSFYCLIPVLIAGFFAMAYVVPSVVEYYYEKTKYIAIGTSIAAVLNAILNMTYIPIYGYVAAAYTTLASYIVYFIIHICISKKLYRGYIVKPKTICLFILTIAISCFLSYTFKDYIIIRIICIVVISLIYYEIMDRFLGKHAIVRYLKQIVQRRRG